MDPVKNVLSSEAPAAPGAVPENGQAGQQAGRLNRTYAMLSDVHQLIVRRYQQEEIYRRACQVAIECGGFRLAWIGLGNPATGRLELAAHGGASPDTVAVLQRMFSGEAPGCDFTAQTLRTGELTVCNDVAVNPRAAPWRELALARGYQSLVSLPLREGDRAIGTFNLYAGEPDFFDAGEIRLLNELASEISLAREMAQREKERLALETRTSRQRDALISHTGLKQQGEDLAAALRRLAESSAVTLETARVSVWRYNADQNVLECRNLYDASTREHTAGQSLAARDYPVYFRTLAEGGIVAVDDGCADPRTREFAESYFRPLGIGAMLDVPLYIGGKVVGVLCHEHVGGPRTWTADEKTFAVAMANLVSLNLEGEERRVLQEQFLRVQRMEAIGTLASGLAHDLNNILAPMLMAAGLLKMKLTTPRDQKIVAMIESGAQRGTGIIRQLLTFGRGVEGARTSVQVRHLVKDITHIVQETFPRNIEFEYSAPATLWPVQADATQLHQVLLNLSVNARDAMPQGGRLSLAAENVRLEAGAPALAASAPPGPYVRLTVTDTGEGIPPAIINRIFDPFFTTKPVGKGTGLGLSSVLSIVKNHDGFLKVASEPGKGSTFDIYLPALDAPASAADAAVADQLPRGAGELVLLVDDEPAMQDTTREMFELHGYRVVTAGNGEEAVKRFLELRGAVRLVVTDVEMPVMGGAELIRSLRVVEKGLQFVVLSGSLTEERLAELQELGIKRVLGKPCEAAQLLQTVHRALNA
jgi:signal transduction histidine kinase/ActR/RegA family two-component response regulator